ncbi:MAG: ABC transporter substrate-binding protein [Proteobacteria bacterium]|nr:ABC transporter substrate-binding protein [Pseudomonadota bacterium]
MRLGHLSAATAIGLAVVVTATTASAQKSKDTLRGAFQSPIKGISYYYDPKPETAMEQAAVYDGLVAFDETNLKYEPLLAKSWKRVGDTAIEFDLRDDVKWHDGEKFDADDVVYTYEWLTDPKTKLRFKRFWNWIAKVEKLGPYKVRITAKRTTPFDLTRHAYLTAIVPEHIHGKLENKALFGQKPVGTGMFRVSQVDKNKGVIFERNDAFKHGGKVKKMSNVKKMTFKAIPDMGTQVAELLGGNLDFIRGATLEQATQLASQPGFTASIGQNLSYIYMAMDARGRSGNKALIDPRVRKALMMGTNRADMLKLLAGDHKLKLPEAMCWRSQAGCDYDAALPKFDPAAAKKLLAEAGYPNGFDLDITTFTSPSIRNTAIFVAGQLKKIGIQTRVDARAIGSYRKKQRDGKIEMIVAGWPAGGFPDVSGTLGFIYASPPKNVYHPDKELMKMARQMNGILDPVKRKALGKKVFNRSTEMAYFIPLIPNPTVTVHRDEVTIKVGAFGAYGIEAWDIRWK